MVDLIIDDRLLARAVANHGIPAYIMARNVVIEIFDTRLPLLIRYASTRASSASYSVIENKKLL
jgi:hypothetical protein